MAEPRPIRVGAARSVDDLYRELIQCWGIELRTRGFTDEQAARLIFVKMLYIRGCLRD